ncbi:hypothetical protein A9970_01025 [Sphingobacterium sp. UME9]|nr:hypothetical protein [Sphingobacterium sp. UME9]
MSQPEKALNRSVCVLSQFLQHGTLQRERSNSYLDGPIGALMKDFLALKSTRRLKPLTMEKIESHMNKFNLWLSVNNIFNICEIEPKHIYGFIKSLPPNKKALIHDTLLDLKGFFRFVYENDIIQTDLAASVPKDNYDHHAKIPSYYTEDEIQRLLNSIDRGTAVGKRDYAILIIAAHLGLRASDIARLKFENLQWEKSTLIIQQYKTGKEILLPLIPVVGNAILDYIQYGRPKCDEQYIFIQSKAPFVPVRPITISTCVGRRFINAGINIGQRRHGAHALRHSLVKELLKNRQTLPVITEVLGHQKTQSTKHYIRIDTESLSQCALEVPMVDPLFYAQKGGILFL